MPATPPANATTTTLQVGTYTPLTDTFTSVVDLNDRTSFWLQNNALKVNQPAKTMVRAPNIRAVGERITAWQYGNRHIQVSVRLRGASTAAMMTSLRSLLALLEAPPFVLRIALPGATAYSYADVVACTHNIPSDPLLILNGTIKDIQIDFECRPGLRGDRLWLQNLVPNPGFEAPAGPGVAVFDDNLANANAYTIQAGGALTQDVVSYADTVMADNPLRYFRLDESSGATAYDATASGHNGTIAGGVTLGTAGLVTGSTDTAMQFDGSTGYVQADATGLPAAAAVVSMHCKFKANALPSSGNSATLMFLGTNVAGQAWVLQIDSSGHVYAGLYGTAQTNGTATITTGTTHHVALTWDGTTLTCYLDGTANGTLTTITPNITYGSLYLGVNRGGSMWFNGVIDEAVVVGSTLSAARVSAIAAAGSTIPSTTASNTLLIPTGGRISFGSPTWGAYNEWLIRFRYRSGLNATFYLHYTNANNYLAVNLTGTTLSLIQTISGNSLILTSGSHPTALINGIFYWLKIVQFPTVAGDPAMFQATILYDNVGTLGTGIFGLGPNATSDAVTALSGQPQIAASGADLTIGGAYSQVHKVWLWGPGGWYVNNGGTGAAVGAWDQSTSDTYPSGPATSYGCARLDAPPAGTWLANWNQDAYGTSTQGWMPVTQNGEVGISLAVNAVGVSATAYQGVWIYEYDSSGNNLLNAQALLHTGPTAGWITLSGTYTLQNANTTQIAIVLRAADATAGASAGGYVLFDNVQVWDVTKTGQTSMPYCELRFPQSPAQLLLSGIAGDMPSPAMLAYATYFYSLPTGQSLSIAIGRRAKSSANARMVATPVGFYGSALSPTSTPTMDSSSYGGYYISASLNNGWSPRGFNFHPDDLDGTFHHVARLLTTQTGSPGLVQARPTYLQRLLPWYGNPPSQADVRWQYYGSLITPFAAGNQWTVVDAGQLVSPPPAAGSLADSSQTYLTTLLQVGDPNVGGSTGRCGWQLLLPIDSSLLIATLTNPSNGAFSITDQWVWNYVDPLARPDAPRGAWGYSLENAAAANPGASAGGAGTTGTGYLNLNPAADPWLILDPALDCNGVSGVNQLAGYLSDTNGDILPFYAEVAYSPLYLYPR